MKKYLFITLILFGCSGNPPESHKFVNEKGKTFYEIEYQSSLYHIEEVNINGHLYLMTRINGNLSLTHAGHCHTQHYFYQ